jgi:hypothetical protein
MRMFRTMAAAQTLLNPEELAILVEEGRRSFVYRDDAGAVVTVGGDMRYRGAWDGGNSYRPGDLATLSGAGYVAKAANSGVEPGTTSGWEDYWDALGS